MRQRQAHAASIVALAWAGCAAAQPALREMELASCVQGTPSMTVPASAERAALDATDLQRFHAAASTRYPLYQRSGLVPAHVLLLRRRGGWQYVTLWPRERGGLCFSAVFAAERFDFTQDWVRKYAPRPAELID